jgi:hypothetical protein
VVCVCQPAERTPMPATTAGPLQLHKEEPPQLERPLCLILHDQHILNADPQYKLRGAVSQGRLCRLRVVKLLKRDSKCFQSVPAAALDRFFTLLAAMPEAAGKRSSND